MTDSRPRKITVVLVDRANYGRMWPVMKAIQDHPALELQVICTGTMLLARFGRAVDVVRKDGFTVDAEIFIEIEGSVPTTMAKSIGMGVIEFASAFQRLEPDIVLLIGDRYEALAAAVSAAYQNLCVAHIQGGEVSGSIDESARHAITKFAHFHFPATRRAAEYILRMGENPDTVHVVGCPCGDSILKLDDELPDVRVLRGVGASLTLDEPYFLVIFHPVTTHCEDELEQVNELLAALEDIHHPTLWLWPNIDAGSDLISKGLRLYREHHAQNDWLHLLKNLPPEAFHRILKGARCAIGNSSSFVRDTTFMGTPVVLVGDRQEGRETGPNLIKTPCRKDPVKEAVLQQMAHGRYAISDLYGTGRASEQISRVLAECTPYRQKRMHFALEDSSS